jgi:hypothetical protein
VAHQELHEPNELWHKKHEREDEKSEERMTENFADYVPVENAHGGKRECSTGTAVPPERFWR